MDLEGVLAIFGFLLYWRAMLCLLASSALALVVTSTSPWISVAQGFVIAFLGFIPGVALEERAAAAHIKSKQQPQPTTSFVAGLSATIAGSVWGGASGVSVQSTISGACLLAVALGGWFWYFHVRTSKVNRGSAYQYMALASGSYVLSALVQNAL
jgi:hypothetical protein